MIEIIKSLNNVKRGDQFFKDNTGEIKIFCMYKSLEIRDLKAGMMYYKNFDEEITCPVFVKIIKENNIKTVAELVEYLAFKSDFRIDEINLKKEFNPFIKLISGELKIKSDGHFNKAQVKKILCHKDTEVVIKEKFSDDYYFDAQNNYFKGVKVENIDALEAVTRSFKSCCKEYDGNEFEIFVAGYSATYIIKNKNIILV